MERSRGVGHEWEFTVDSRRYAKYRCKKCGNWFTSAVHAAPSSDDCVIVSGKWLSCEEAQICQTFKE